MLDLKMTAITHIVAVLLALTVGSQATWVQTWGDEFEGSSINNTKWEIRNNQTHCCGPLGNDELELYVSNASYVYNGSLHLHTSWNPTTGPKRGGGTKLFHYTSGWIDSKGLFSQMYGRFVARCRLPTYKATGIWPAFWLMPQSTQCWPTGGEIDIFEFNGNPIEDKIYGSYHWAKEGECDKDKAPIPGKGTKPHGTDRDWQTEWHEYAVEWSEEGLKFFLDDVMYFEKTASEVDLPSAPMYIIFDQAVDQTIFVPLPGNEEYKRGITMEVDWVRVYKLQQ